MGMVPFISHPLSPIIDVALINLINCYQSLFMIAQKTLNSKSQICIFRGVNWIVKRTIVGELRIKRKLEVDMPIYLNHLPT